MVVTQLCDTDAELSQVWLLSCVILMLNCLKSGYILICVILMLNCLKSVYILICVILMLHCCIVADRMAWSRWGWWTVTSLLSCVTSWDITMAPTTSVMQNRSTSRVW